MEVAFKYLSLGAKFSFLGHDRTVFVKLSDKDCARWDHYEPIVCFAKQVVMPFGDVNKLVDLRETYSSSTYHHFPKTVYQEGYDYYLTHPFKFENPYEKDSKAYDDFNGGHTDAFWDDCE